MLPYRLQLALREARGIAADKRAYRAMSAQDRAHNAAHATADRRVLIVRESAYRQHTNGTFLAWLTRHRPDAAAHFEVHRLPVRGVDWSKIALVHQWLQDPVRERSARVYRLARRVEDECAQRHIPCINPIDVLSNSIRSVQMATLATAGLRVPRTVPIVNPQAFRLGLGGLPLPLLVRGDRGHGGSCFLLKDRAELSNGALSFHEHAVAMEFIDTRGPDGLYRKYRYVLAGDRGLPRHLIVSPKWEVRPKDRVINEQTRAEELTYLNAPDPHHDAFNAARKALGFDVVAFDYSYDAQGRIVVWEANPFPELDYPRTPGMEYLVPFVNRTFEMLLAMYLERAGVKLAAR